MKDYNEFPPVNYFTRVLKSCPKSALLYVQIWQSRNKNMVLLSSKKNIRKDFLISPTMFRNLLAPLMYLNLIHFIESDVGFQVTVLGPNSND